MRWRTVVYVMIGFKVKKKIHDKTLLEGVKLRFISSFDKKKLNLYSLCFILG